MMTAGRKTRSRAPRRRIGGLGVLAIVAALILPSVQVQPASAYEAATAAWSVPAGSSSSLALPSGVTATVTTTGLARVREPSTLGSKGFSSDFFTPGNMVSQDPSIDIYSMFTGCAPVGTCTDLGTMTITFSQPVHNPTLHLTGLGGSKYGRLNGELLYQSDLHAALTLTTPGVSIEAVSGNENFAVVDGVVTAVNDSASLSCTTRQGTANAAAATASCGSAQVIGTVTSLTFDLSGVAVKNPLTPNPARYAIDTGDVFGMAITVPQDLATGPASYDAAQAPAHVLSDLTLGAAVEEDVAAVRNPTTGTTADTTDAFGALPDVVAEPGATYSLDVPVAGASRDAHVCGYLDLDRNGTFDTAEERACGQVAAGATSAELSWTMPGTVDVGATQARFRIGYTRSQVESPTGLADSGEVEDYPLTILARPQLVLTKTTEGGAGAAFDYTLTNTTQATATVTTGTADGTVQVDGDPQSDGVQAFTVSEVGTDVTITETETAGWRVSGATCTTAAGEPVGSLNGSTYTVPGGALVGGAVITCGYTNTELVPALTLDKSSDGVTDLDGNGPDAGDSMGFSLTVTNTGSTALSDLLVTDPTAGEVTCPATRLAPGAAMTCTATYELTRADVEAGEVVNTATATATAPSGATVSASDSVASSLERTASLHFLKTADAAGRVLAGDRVEFSFTVTNTGNVDLSEVAVTDPMTGTVACPATTLAPGATMVCTAPPYQVTSTDAAAGQIVNTAVVSARAAGAEQPLTSRASVTVMTARALPRTGPSVSLAGVGTALTLGALGAALVVLGRRQRPQDESAGGGPR